MNKNILRGLALVGVLASVSASAAIDVTAATTSIGEIIVAIAAVFGAMVAVVAGVKGFKMVLSFIGSR